MGPGIVSFFWRFPYRKVPFAPSSLPPDFCLPYEKGKATATPIPPPPTHLSLLLSIMVCAQEEGEEGGEISILTFLLRLIHFSTCENEEDGEKGGGEI